MHIFLLTLSLLTLSLNTSAQTYTGKFDSKILGPQKLQVAISAAMNSTAPAEAYASREYDSELIYCNTGLNFKNLGAIQFTLNGIVKFETISAAVGSMQTIIENEDSCTALQYSNSDLQNNQWIYSGTNSSLILSVKTKNGKTLTRRLTLQFSMPMMRLNGLLLPITQTNQYVLENIELNLNSKTYITYQIVDETRAPGEYSSISTLEQGRIYLK